MKTNIHPKLNTLTITCSSCGSSFETQSTRDVIHIEVCNKCHPFYTGEHRFVDTQGRVENFQKKQQNAETMKAKISNKKQKKFEKSEKQVKSLRELLGES
jgi:large subunit ribosomal protein L31